MASEATEFDWAREGEKRWRSIAAKQTDSGDYTEPSGPNYRMAAEVMRTYQKLVDLLLAAERQGLR